MMIIWFPISGSAGSLYWMDTEETFSGGEAAYLLPFTVEVKNEWSYNTIPP